MNEELYINGQAVDIGNDTGISLKFKSNLFGDISKIEASRSYTIRLPKTLRNRQIFDDALTPSHLSTFRYRSWPAQYVRNGVLIIPNGEAVLTGGSDAYEIALVWDGLSAYRAWVDASAKLADLKLNESYVWQSQPPSQFPPSTSALTIDYESGVGNYSSMSPLAQSKVALLPSANLLRLVEQMQADSGVSFSFSQNVRDAMAMMAIPCLTHKGMAAPFTLSFSGVNADVVMHGGLAFTASGAPNFYTLANEEIVFEHFLTTATILKPVSAGEIDLAISLAMTVRASGQYAFEYSPTLWALVRNQGGAIVSRKMIPPIVSVTGERIATVSVRDWAISANIPEGGSLCFILSWPVLGSFQTVSGTASCNIAGEEQTLVLGDTMDVAYNLPDISQVDLMKALCAIFGLQVVNGKQDDTLLFVSVDDLLSRRGEALDWSDKLVDGSGFEPKSVSLKVGSFVQRNLFRWKEDDTVPAGYGDGAIIVENAVVSAEEKDAAKMPFSASVGFSVPVFEYNSDRSDVETASIKPRIMRIVETTTGTSALSFSGLDFPTLIATYYTGLREMLAQAVSIKAEIRLNELDLRDLDYTRPIYLAQYGRFFAISTVDVGKTSTATVELIQLPL